MVLKPTGGWGYQSDTEFLFPMRVAPLLRDLRDEHWAELVDRAASAPDGSEEQLAFSLLMVRLAGCLTCHTDSYRAVRGCSVCAQQAIRRQRSNTDELDEALEGARQQVRDYIDSLAITIPAEDELAPTQ